MAYGTRAGVRMIPLKKSESTHPWMPGTEMQSEFCQNVQPWPPQLLPGTVGVGTNQWAIHSRL